MDAPFNFVPTSVVTDSIFDFFQINLEDMHGM